MPAAVRRLPPPPRPSHRGVHQQPGRTPPTRAVCNTRKPASGSEPRAGVPSPGTGVGGSGTLRPAAGSHQRIERASPGEGERGGAAGRKRAEERGRDERGKRRPPNRLQPLVHVPPPVDDGWPHRHPAAGMRWAGGGGWGGGGTADRSRGGANELRHPPPPSRRAATGSAAVPGGRGGGVARTTHGHLYNHQDYSYQKGRRGGPRRCGTGPPFPPPPSSSPSPSAKRKKKTRDQPINSARGPATPPQPGGAVSDTRPTCNAKRKPQVLRSSGSAGSWPHAAGARW